MRYLGIYLFIFSIFFSYYITFEVVFNSIARCIGWYDVFSSKKSVWTMEGYASIWVGILGGLVGIITYFILSSLYYFRLNLLIIFPFSILSSVLITTLEYILGTILNKFNIRPWDYSNEPFNFQGSVSLFRSIGWVGIGAILYLLIIGIYNLLNPINYLYIHWLLI